MKGREVNYWRQKKLLTHKTAIPSGTLVLPKEQEGSHVPKYCYIKPKELAFLAYLSIYICLYPENRKGGSFDTFHRNQEIICISFDYIILKTNL